MPRKEPPNTPGPSDEPPRSPRPLPLQRGGRRRARPMAKADGPEWVGGIVEMPAYVTEDDESYRPEVLVWLGERGLILGSLTGKPGELLAQAGESLRETIAQPMVGPSHRPGHVRIADSRLASAVREANPEVEIVCAPTPELDEVLDSMRGSFAGSDGAASYLSPGVTAKDMASVFAAAAEFYRAKPWTVLRDALSLVAATSTQLGLRDAAISVMGQLGESFGFLLFDGIDELDAYMDAGEARARGEHLDFPPHLSVHFERGADVDPRLRKEIAAHDWEVAEATAYPAVIAVDHDLVARPLTASDLGRVESLLVGLVALVAAKKELRRAARDEVCFELALALPGSDAPYLTLRVPFE